MKDRTKLKAKYRFIPCIYNQLDDELHGANEFLDLLLSAVLWIDVNVFMVERFPLWVEDWNDIK